MPFAIKLQWGRDLAVTETIRSCIASSALFGFNGAVTLRSRKHCRDHQTRTCQYGLQWGRDLAVTETRTPSCRRERSTGFNGAVTLRSRKRTSRAPTSRLRSATLQWGRDLAVTETPAAGE